MKRHTKLTLLGIVIGALGNLLGFALYSGVFCYANKVTFQFFMDNYWAIDDFKSKVITGSLIVNVLLFYILMKKNQDDISKGMLITILLSVIAIIYYFA